MIVNNKIEYFFINKCVQISVPNFKDYDVYKNYVQRTGLYAGWELVFRLPTTAAD